MTLTTTEPNLSQEIGLGGVEVQYEELKKIFQKLIAKQGNDAPILTTSWAHFLQYLPKNSINYTRLTQNSNFNRACASNPYMPLDVARLYFSTSLTSKRLLLDSYGYTSLVVLGENPHIRLVWLALKTNLDKDPLVSMLSIIRLGHTPEDVLLDMYELLPPNKKKELVQNAVETATCNIPAVFLNHLGQIGAYAFESTHLEQTLKILANLGTEYKYDECQRLAFGAQLHTYVAKVIDEYQNIKRSESVRPDAGSNTNQSRPQFCVGQPVSTNDTGVSSASDSAIPPVVAETA
jgi:hypothetical protein